MNRLTTLAALCGTLLAFQVQAFAQPAPAEKGLAAEGPEVLVQVDTKEAEVQEKSGAQENLSKTPQEQAADLKAEIETLRAALAKMTEAPQKDLEAVESRVKILEADNTTLSARIKALESEKDKLDRRVASLEADNATLQENLAKMLGPLPGDATGQRMAAKPAFVNAAVRFYNYEGRNLRMNVNGVWHTLKPGENDVPVPYGPVHIYRYTGAEPKMFKDWKPFQDGYIMEFDVGTPTK